MADTSPNLMTSAGGAYDRGCFRRGGTCACGGGVCGKEARATPPSPSTASIKQWHERIDGEMSGDTMPHAMKAEILELRAALASRPAEVDDEGLPPLPAPVDSLAQEDGFGVIGTVDVFTAEQYRQGQRDAVAADRARRGDRR